jgi:hypothetical protein
MSDRDHGHAQDSDTLILDQVCMIAVSGAFGAICLALYIGNAIAAEGTHSMLARLLGTQFHLFVLASGIALVVVSLVRGVALWRQTGRPAHSHPHVHEHEHANHPGECAEHHSDGPHHHHDHDAADHDHGWAPWRYVLLLVPIVLFLLGLPNNGPTASAMPVTLDMTQETASYVGMVASVPNTPGDTLSWLAALYMSEGEAQELSFKELEGYGLRAHDPNFVREKRGKAVRVRGQFAPNPASDHAFLLVRFRMQCCAADVIPLKVPIVTRERLSTRPDLREFQWVRVTGVIDFRRVGNEVKPVLCVGSLRSIEPYAPDSHPYIQ